MPNANLNMHFEYCWPTAIHMTNYLRAFKKHLSENGTHNNNEMTKGTS